MTSFAAKFVAEIKLLITSDSLKSFSMRYQQNVSEFLFTTANARRVLRREDPRGQHQDKTLVQETAREAKFDQG